MKKKKKLVRYRRRLHINIGIVIFAFILLYVIVSLISYLISDSVAMYEVQKGTISDKVTSTGLALRTEEVTYAESAGTINYYKKEGDKAGYADTICSIDREGSISSSITQAGLDGSTLSEQELLDIQDDITEFSGTYSNMQFYKVYSFKNSTNARIQESLYVSALEALSEETSNAISQNQFSILYAAVDGVLAFYTDGYENVSPDTFTPDMYNPSEYQKNNLKSSASVASGQALYKTVTSENWYIMVPITQKEADHYREEMGEGQESFVLHTTFCKDDTSAYATASIRDFDSGSFLQLKFNSSMVRFIGDRYIELELGSGETSGLKIPNTSITQKDFIQVPKEYITRGGDSKSPGVLKVTTDQSGKETVEFIVTNLYYETENTYYIYDDDLALGDRIQRSESTDQYTLTDTGTLPGVYVMNSGYAVFKQIDILAQNEEYAIVGSRTGYLVNGKTRSSISLYDYIALDGSSVHEGQLSH